MSYSTISKKCNYFNSTKNHSVSVIQDIIDEMDGKLIYRFSGDRIEGSPEQYSNKYISSKHMTDELKQKYANHVDFKTQKKNKIRKDNEIIKYNAYFGDDMTVKELKSVLKRSNWGKRDPYTKQYNELEYFDYYVYRLAKDEGVASTFVISCEKRIEAMKDNPHCPYDFETWEKEYLDDITDNEDEIVESKNVQDIQDKSEFIYQPDYSDIYNDDYSRNYKRLKNKSIEASLNNKEDPINDSLPF